MMSAGAVRQIGYVNYCHGHKSSRVKSKSKYNSMRMHAFHLFIVLGLFTNHLAAGALTDC